MSAKILRDVGGTLVQVLDTDAVISHEAVFSSVVTEHPVEGGGTVTDNVRNDPVEFTMTGFVSNYPTEIGLGLIPMRDDSRAKTALEVLEEIRNAKETVEIQDNLRIYKNMLLTNLRTPRNTTTHNGLQFTASFKEIEIVGVQVAALEDDPQTEQTAAEASDLGKQTPSDSKPEVEDRSSTLVRILKYAGRIE